MRRQITFIAAAFLVMLAAGTRPASAGEPWKYSLTPYLWLPTINGTLKYDLPDGGMSAIEIGPNDYLSNLKLAAMVAGEARNGRFSLGSDLIYLNFQNETSKVRSVDLGNGPIEGEVNTSTESSLDGLAWTFVGGYAVSPDPDAPFDLIAGARYFGLKSDTKWELSGTGGCPCGSSDGRISRDVDLWDGIVGFKGRAKLGGRWHMPYYADIGTGSSALTWQAMLGVTYAYGWGDVGLAYRHLAYDQDDDEMVQDFTFSGPALSVGFHF